MTANTYISLLRGINVSGQKKIQMAELQRLYEGLGFSDVRTYVQSGNILFTSLVDDASKLAAQIEAQIEQFFGFSVVVFIRQPQEFQRILDGNPFLNRPNIETTRLLVTFLHRTPAENSLSNLASPNTDGDEFYLGKQEIYLFCPNGYGKSKLSNTFFERKFGMPATTRNWNTVNALYQMATEGL